MTRLLVLGNDRCRPPPLAYALSSLGLASHAGGLVIWVLRVGVDQYMRSELAFRVYIYCIQLYSSVMDALMHDARARVCVCTAAGCRIVI